MTKTTAADASSQVYKILEAFEASERRRIVQAVLTLFGDSAPIDPSPGSESAMGRKDAERSGSSRMGTEQQFFDQKAPETKIEELAVAARFLELSQSASTQNKENLRETVRSARRNFDDKNFPRDLKNAKRAGLFNKGNDIVLAYYGQNYVDALPDREKVKQLPRPKGSRRTSKAKRESK